ncbi:MAG: cyclodeaminase/cyclohydrolase family protein [Methylibium sp.]|uniref:methenyltetrahydrofolate cyclohydrolase n=1 Tax=Methylibium sp. TaxID=2067992 RepID=UPI0017F641F3|nr:methenyltetrahydrofolate cyclohydrolase [Methylibium sp.]MBA3596315.1 cyclodeaminase/cyclohydrolase family protein [Methylibium sp.]
MITDLSTEAFLDALASGNATPGGGSAAAVMGAMAAALVSMVCNLTIGKKGYESAEAEMKSVLGEAEALRARLLEMVPQDIAAFDWLMAGYKLPKGTDAEKAARSAAIQKGLQGATQVPLDCAVACAEVLRLTARSVEVGNVNVISDVGVGVLAGWAALRSAALNVHINAPQIKDREFAESRLAQLEQLLAECGPLTEQVHAKVHGKLG